MGGKGEGGGKALQQKEPAFPPAFIELRLLTPGSSKGRSGV